ncbi:MAG: DUF1232 domain-containing protein, partial [Fimbriimonadaceae bacterium]|nr:DUF1232 domain-containing protein [Fimbriimonadaceae bacterium]
MKRWGLLPLIFRSLRSRRRAAWMVGVLALAYLVSPIDLLPDPLLVIGWLDDLGVAAWALSEVLALRGTRTAEEPGQTFRAS